MLCVATNFLGRGLDVVVFVLETCVHFCQALGVLSSAGSTGAKVSLESDDT